MTKLLQHIKHIIMLKKNCLKFEYKAIRLFNNCHSKFFFFFRFSIFFFFFEDNTIEFLFHRIGTYIKKIGAGDMFPAQQIPNPNNKVARGA